VTSLRVEKADGFRYLQLWREVYRHGGLGSLPLFGMSQIAVSFGYFRERFGQALRYGAFWVCLSLMLLGVLARLGAFEAEFGGPDEASHVVSGVMVHEYLRHGILDGKAPMVFAQEYHAQYPKVAIGHWPPGFYLLQGLWMFVAGVSRESTLILSAVSTAGMGLLAVWLCRQEGLRWTLAAAAGAVTALVPVSLQSTMEIGSDITTATATLGAAIVCQYWLRGLSARAGVLFAVCAAAAILCKGTAFCLLLVPFLSAGISKRYYLLRTPKFWLPIFGILALTVPWYLYAAEWTRGEVIPGELRSLWTRLAICMGRNTGFLPVLSGYATLVLAMVSLRTGWVKRWGAVAVLPAAMWIFLSLISPHSEVRLLVASVPVFSFAAAVGAQSLSGRGAEAMLVLALVVAHWQWPLRDKPQRGFVSAVDWVQRQSGLKEPRVLVSSNASGEGAWISEVCLKEPIPRGVIFRAGKEFESSSWMGHNMQLLVESAGETEQVLERKRVELVILHEDESRPKSAHQAYLEEALVGWQIARQFGEVKLYRRPARSDERSQAR
jgi:hypothetical protein